MRSTIQAVRALNDLLPADSAAWQALERAARETFAEYGYREIAARPRAYGAVQAFHRRDSPTSSEGDVHLLDRGGGLGHAASGGDRRHRPRLPQNGLLHNQRQKLWSWGRCSLTSVRRKVTIASYHQIGRRGARLRGARPWMPRADPGSAAAVGHSASGRASALQLNSLHAESRTTYRGQLGRSTTSPRERRSTRTAAAPRGQPDAHPRQLESADAAKSVAGARHHHHPIRPPPRTSTGCRSHLDDAASHLPSTRAWCGPRRLLAHAFEWYTMRLGSQRRGMPAGGATTASWAAQVERDRAHRWASRGGRGARVS